MVVDKKVLDALTESAKASPRLRIAYDLRNTPMDDSQRMLNAIEPGTEIPIHRHLTTNETVLCVVIFRSCCMMKLVIWKKR